MDPLGRVVGQVDYFASQGRPLIAQLPVGPVGTIYATIGDLLAYICQIGTVALLITGLVRRQLGKKAAVTSSETGG